MESNQHYNDRHDTIFTDDFFGDQYQPASKGQRFLNWLIDGLVMGFGVTWITVFLSFFIMEMFAPWLITEIDNNEGYVPIFLFFIVAANHLLYYVLCERLFKGKTVGKLITGTKAVRDDGTPLTFRDAFLRSLSRLTPFEPFSIFIDKPWHDSWTRTSVVKK